MLKWSLEKKANGLMMSAALLVALAATGCGSGETVNPTATKQGTVNLDQIKVGIPESTIKEAILTFVPDPKGSVAGKVQYLSRQTNANGGQVIAQCKNDQCFGLQIYHMDKPVTKEVAVASMQGLLPSDAPPQSKVDDKSLKEGKDANPIEIYWFGDSYRGELVYADKTGSQVKIISTWYEPKAGTTTSEAGGDAKPAGDATPKAEAPAGDG